MNNTWDETLVRITEQVLESLAFVLPAFDDDVPPDGQGERTTASITFVGPFEGRLIGSISSCLLPEVSANMLGLDFDDIPSKTVQTDAFKELLNVICGNLLPELAGDEAVFAVNAAELIQEGSSALQAGESAPTASARLTLEGGWIELALYAPQAAHVGANGGG